MKRRAFMLWTLFMVQLSVLGVCGSAQALDPLSPGANAPAFSLLDERGAAVSLDAYRGKIVVLEWTNPDCPFVRRHYAQKTMISLAQRYAARGVVWLAINSSRKGSMEANLDFHELYSLPYPVLDDRTGVVGKLYGATSTPHLFVVSADGKVAYQGAIDSDPGGDATTGVVNFVALALDALLQGAPVGTPSTKAYGCSVKYAS